MISTILENFKKCEDDICAYRLPLEKLFISRESNFTRIEWIGMHTNIYVDFDENFKPLYFEFYSVKARLGVRKKSVYYPDEYLMNNFIKYVNRFIESYDGYTGDYEARQVEDKKKSIELHNNPENMLELLKTITIPYDVGQIEDYDLKIFPPLWK